MNLTLFKKKNTEPGDNQDERTSLTGGGGTGRIVPGQIMGCRLGIFSLPVENSGENV